MLRYHQIYRTEADRPELQFRALTGAASWQEGRWIFWVWNCDPYIDPTVSFRISKQKDLGGGSVEVTVLLGERAEEHRLLFIPLTVDYLAENAEAYGLSADFVSRLHTPGMKEAYFQMDISEVYNQTFEPAEDDEVYAEQRATIAGGTLKVENGCFYESQKDGSWKKLDWFP